MNRKQKPGVTEGIAEVMTGVQIPLENIEFTIDQYLLTNGWRLDTETRFLLAGVRDGVGRVAGSTKRMVRESTDPNDTTREPV